MNGIGVEAPRRRRVAALEARVAALEARIVAEERLCEEAEMRNVALEAECARHAEALAEALERVAALTETLRIERASRIRSPQDAAHIAFLASHNRLLVAALRSPEAARACTTSASLPASECASDDDGDGDGNGDGGVALHASDGLCEVK